MMHGTELSARAMMKRVATTTRIEVCTVEELEKLDNFREGRQCRECKEQQGEGVLI